MVKIIKKIIKNFLNKLGYEVRWHYPELTQMSFDEIYQKFFNKNKVIVFDVGANNESTDINNSPELYASGAEVRYNTITSRVYDVHVSCNIELEAGMRIRLKWNCFKDLRWKIK